MRRMRTFSFGRPRPLSRERHARPGYTLNREQPD
jgi:hypothetical protein